MCNKTKAILDEADTDTNRSEGFNSALKKRTPRNANLFALLEQVKREDAMIKNKIRNAAFRNPDEDRPRNINRQFRKQELKNLVQSYDRLYKDNFFQKAVEFYKNKFVNNN